MKYKIQKHFQEKEAEGHTIEDAVKQTGISRASLFRIKKARSVKDYDLKMSMLLKLSRYFNTSVTDLIGG